MSQVKLNLQPPPNVDFVTGYPGIPPGQDRPQASVRGAIEVRVTPQGVKAKWVRVELRKVETLPGGGPANTFYDFVGPSPVNLWSTSDEYGLLRSQDFPFSIRIPESIPPTIALDGKAGIGYELVASVCTKGKKGFLRKAKSVVASTIAPIIIDKHELHSTWPVYQQPETRHLAQEGVNLIIERKNTCFGPGDRVSVVATVKSDSLHTVILRGFEMTLREATVFRAGVHTAGKKNAPQVRQVNIAETKVGVNATLYGGTAHTSELSCMIQPDHTTTSLNAARHIDITYTLCIKALMGTGAHLVMDLPVIISNWQSRIGPAPSLSLLPPTIPGAAPITRIDPVRGRADPPAATLPLNRPTNDGGYGHTRNASSSAYNTLPATSSTPADDSNYGTGYGLGRPGNGLVDEFGSNANSRPVISAAPSTTGSVATPAPVLASSTGRTAGSSSTASRFMVKNAEVPQANVNRQRSAQQGQGSGSGSGSGSTAQPAKQWPTAEEEKLLYEQARAKVAHVQGEAAAPPPALLRASPPPQAITTPANRGPTAPATSTPTKNAWLSAEEEKRLFQQAQAAVQRNQGVQPANALGGGSNHTRNDSDPKTSSGSGSKQSTGAALYAQAINARSAASGQAGGSASASTAKTVPQYQTAEQEKAALRRYEEARRAVDRTQNTSADDPVAPPANSGPIAYESLFPASRGAPAQSSAPPPADAPPPFDSAAGGSNIMAHLSEKERLRRAYEAQDAARQANPSPPPPAAYSAPTPAPAPASRQPVSPAPLPGQYANALEEKEALRRKFEARDNANAQPVLPPPRSNNVAASPPANTGGSSALPRSPGANASGFRPAPVPPAASPTKVLTAAEEKALLRAKYEVRDSGNRPAPVVTQTQTNGNSSANGVAGSVTTPTTPPPLMPRPPVEYIKETQEEDARLSRINGEIPKLNGSSSSASLNKPSSGAGALDMKPFTPFRAGFDPNSIAPPGPPPPLPKSE
ncbi:hypothetical protein CVT25_011884 [Psilocybe cyanescens]|uniref:Arrestin C-terminal-like domain-containing protein n=1 Tax=Psilocybe cyanescens TaxID=93625 RepID=A0A409WIW8_PSICY|nr:hypothetical protein CVT25_011884 [Psilocybe cyanescens]